MVAGRLEELLGQRDAPVRGLEVGAGTGMLTRHLARLVPRAFWHVNDLSPKAQQYLDPLLEGLSHRYLWGDAELLELPGDLGLIATASTVQWFDDLPAFIARCAGALAPGGLLVMTTFGPDNFRQIRATTGRGLEYRTLSGLEMLLRQAGFEPLILTEFRSELAFVSPMEVLRHIKATGVGGTGHFRWSPSSLRRFDEQYRRLFASADNGVTLTYHPQITISKI